MRGKRKKAMALVLTSLVGASLFAGCGKKYDSLGKDVEGTIDMMLWSGDNTYTEDIGHKDIPAKELLSQNKAAAYAVAKAFNEMYPKVKINVYVKQGGPDDNKTPWAQELENFRAQHGKYPDVYASTNLIGDIGKGMVADLSRFKDDPLYKSFNPSIMKMMNYYGFQGGLPQFMQPWGIYVNRQLAQDHNLDVPDPDWTIDDYTSFIRQGDKKNFFGAMDVSLDLIRTGTKSFVYQLKNRKPGEPFVKMDSDEIFSMLDYIPKWADNAIWPQKDIGNVSDEFMKQNDWWSYNFFKNGVLLTLSDAPWMMGDAANPDVKNTLRVKSDDWDIYPRPATKYCENTVGIVLDPMVVMNHAMQDGNPEESKEEAAQTKLAYTFAAFWAADTKSWEARAKQEFSDNGNMKTAMNDSLPLVTGDEFKKQMDIWYSVPIHQRFKDQTKMPGWHKILEIWEKGQFWDVSDKTYPWFFTKDGSTLPIMNQWLNIYKPEIAGARRTDPNFVDSVKSKLPDWNKKFNERFKEAEQALRDSLVKYYGFKESDFTAKDKSAK